MLAIAKFHLKNSLSPDIPVATPFVHARRNLGGRATQVGRSVTSSYRGPDPRNKTEGTMKKRITVLLSGAAMAGLLAGGARAFASHGLAGVSESAAAQAAPAQQPGAPKQPQWKSRAEYDDFQKILANKDPHAMITAADAFLQKYPTSDFKDQADLIKMQAYQQLNQPENAMNAAKDALKVNPDNLGALNYLCFAMPFVFKPTDPNKDAELSDLDADAKKGLDVLSRQQKPPNMSDADFNTQIKQLRANFNDAEGFVALQKKDYAGAITSQNAAKQDNPSDPFIFYRLGLAYLNSSPPDYDHAIWNLARAADLAKTSKTSDAAAIEKFYQQVYQSRHGSDAGQNELETQAASSVDPPTDFKVAAAAKHAPTGNQFIDAFYSYEDALKSGGDTETTTWSQIKGQPFGGPGYVNAVPQKDPSSDAYLVHVDITSPAKGKSGAYDIELKDSQPGCKDLGPGDPVRFTGTISAYTVTPSFVLTLDNGHIEDQDLQAAADAKKAAAGGKKTPPRRHHPSQ
jgi:tetratricopeptide (TPR) repeat protein